MSTTIYHYVYQQLRDNGEFYIGIHSDDRPDDNYKGSGTKFKNKFNSNPARFTKTILWYGETRDAIEEMEAAMVTKDMLLNPLCLNLMTGGGNGLHSDETKAKLSAIHLKRYKNPETLANHRAMIKKRNLDDPSILAKISNTLQDRADKNQYNYFVELFTGDYNRILSKDRSVIPRAMFNHNNANTRTFGDTTTTFSASGILMRSVRELSSDEIRNIFNVVQKDYNALMRNCYPTTLTVVVDGIEHARNSNQLPQTKSFKNILRNACKLGELMFTFKEVEYTINPFTNLYSLNRGR